MKNKNVQIPTSRFYDVLGFYYSIGKKNYRKQLEIKLKGSKKACPDLIVVMMNPGGSIPINGDFNSKALTEAVPDATQYRIMDFMYKTNFEFARVLNLSDICEKKSYKFYKSISLKSNTHSIFNPINSNELKKLFIKSTPTLIAWGVNEKLNPLIKDAIQFIQKNSSYYFGFEKLKSQNKFYHPMKRNDNNGSWIDGAIKSFNKIREAKK